MSLNAPTVEEQAWMDDIVRIGCCVCVRTGLGETPASVHHMLTEGHRKIGHLFTIPLCYSHHQAELNNAQIVSRHHWRREFERRYGTEAELLEWTQQRVQELRACAVS